MSPGWSDSIGTRRPSAFVTNVPQRRQLLEPDPEPEPLPEPLELGVEPLPDGVIDSVELLLLDELLLESLADDPPPDVPPPPLDDPPPPLDDPPPPEELPPPPLDDGVPSVLSVLSDELDGLLEDGVAVSVLLGELDAVSVELSVGAPGSLELGVSLLLLRLDVPLPGGCCVVAQTGI